MNPCMTICPARVPTEDEDSPDASSASPKNTFAWKPSACPSCLPYPTCSSYACRPIRAATLPGRTYLVFTGSTGGGMIFGNEFRVREAAASRHWGMMGFDTLNRAIEGQLVTARQSDDGGDYVVEVKFNADDTVRYWINKQSFLIDKITTRYRSQVLIEEQRSDYRRADCMMLPFHVITRLQGQPLADLDIQSYDLKSVVPAATFTMTATP